MDCYLDTARPTADASSTPPSGPMTRTRAKAIRDKVNSFLSTCDLHLPLNGLLPHADTLCILRYNSPEDASKDHGVAQPKSWTKQGEGDAENPAPAVPPVTPVVLPPRPTTGGTTDASTALLPPNRVPTYSNASTTSTGTTAERQRYYRRHATGTTAASSPVLPPRRKNYDS